MGWAAVPYIVAAAGTAAAARSQQMSYDYQAQVAQNNQKIANQNATYAVQRGQIMEQQKRTQTAQLIGQERAVAGATGLDVNTGSNKNVQESTAQLGEFDAQVIRNSAAREAYGYTVQGLNYGAQGQLDAMNASNALTAGLIGAAGQGLKGFGPSGPSSDPNAIGDASTVAPKWAWMQDAGVAPSPTG